MSENSGDPLQVCDEKNHTVCWKKMESIVPKGHIMCCLQVV